MNRAAVAAIVLIIGTSTLAGCSSRLTREQAASAISQHEFFKATQNPLIPVGEYCHALHKAYADPGWFLADQELTKPLTYLKTHGYMEVTVKHFSSFEVGMMKAEQMLGGSPSGRFPEACRHPTGNGLDYYYWTSKVTPKGVQSGLPKDGGNILAAKRGMGEVTGLVENKDNSVTAEFEWQWEPTPEGAAFMLVIHNQIRFKGSAVLKKYDDGWRVVEVKDEGTAPPRQ